jgi:TetR/AcrR family transcriptional regulator, repressor for uid operon
MRRANTQLQADRRTEILDAAQTCFARSGFHQASMQEICAEADMSPGNLYRYFPSKEAIIADICERDRAEAVESFKAVHQAPDFFTGLAGLARFHLVERTAEQVGLCAEIMAESRRNPEIARVYQDVERDIKMRLQAMLQQAADGGEVRRDLDLASAATVLLVLADGISWRRAVDPNFDPEKMLPMVLHMVGCLLGKPAGPGKEASR